MRTSSINIILAGIAVCNLVCMGIGIRNWYSIQSLMVPCTYPKSLIEFHFDWILSCVHDAFRRSSAWLGVSLTILRYHIITDISRRNGKLTKPANGLKEIFMTFFVGFWISLLFYFNTDIAKSGIWKPALDCGISEQIPVYTLKYNAFFEKNNYFFTRARLVLEGIFVKLFPCISSSIFTGLMLQKLKKSMSSSSSKSKTDRTSFLAIFISISFIITEFPIGIVDLYKAIWAVDSYNENAQYTILICDALFTMNSTFHCFLIFFMSAQYRRTFWNLIQYFNCCTEKKIFRVTTVQSSLQS
ncbi:hypothetical protein B9Z55_018405 [Caenorhabditis nigoni]|uniref:G-protein coupled receptors family 1 profile domain-containing protein n=1 Tax=Caenorhabditis nigoni TaxID=1611254 RepID=A0A2G5TE01_9PELO|nr:hypothetical protein B9Z55_018405 [Caenorhabditis nigoni]